MSTQVQEFSHKRALRAGFASFIGTAIEFYDFYIFATAAALLFGPLFFPEIDPALGVLASFATYATGFLVRPLGGILFGYIGDRFGRQRSLVLTLLLMGAATLAVGLLPTYASIGLGAPILLVLLRMLQGLAVGGEWGGAVLMAVENAPERYKGFYGSLPQLGNPMGALMATGVFSLLTLGGEEFMLDWGWRIPFLISAVLIAVGFWIRRSVEETPVFEQAQAAREAAGGKQDSPLKKAVTKNWRAILIGIGLVPISTGGYYLITTFATTYATQAQGIDATLFLNVLTVAAFFELISTLGIGVLADRMGRKKVMAISLIVTALAIIPMFLTIGNAPVWVMFVLFSIVRITINGTWAPLSAIMAQMFDADSRQTSLSLSYSTGNALWAGLSPIVAMSLYTATGSIWPAIGIFIGLSLLSLVCVILAPQRKDYVFDPNTSVVSVPGEK